MDVADVKYAAAGRWSELLESLAGIPRELLDGQHHPCPKCGGVDRFRLLDESAGALICNQCFASDNGDGIAAVRWATGWTFPEAVTRIGAYLGLNGHGNGKAAAVDPLDALCRAKRMPRASAIAYGARVQNNHVEFPSWGADGERLSDLSLWATGTDKQRKGLWRKGETAGVFLPVDGNKPRLPAPGETWYLVEGPKDAAALHGLGFLAVGLNTCNMNQKFAPLLRGCHVVLVPDRDTASIEGMETTARRLVGVAASIKVAALPAEVTATNGKDVRDILGQRDGETLVRKAIAGAREWQPPTFDAGSRISNGRHVPKDDGKGTIVVARPIQAVIDAIRERTEGFPHKANGAMFVDVEGRIDWLEDPASYFGWLHSLGGVEWHQGPAFVTKSELFAEHGRLSRKFDAIELHPHEPVFPTHYYACPAAVPGNGDMLRRLLDMFSPATPIDRDLIQAALMTLAWGGPGGKRPLFIVTSNGRGHGKTTLAEVLAGVFGGVIAFSMSEKASDIKSRLLSPEGLDKRAALLDNVKSHKFSWGDLEALVTCESISGKRMYVGEANRPNTICWFCTLNGVALSKDMAQRAVVIKVSRPTYSGNWEADIGAFIEANRQQIIGDIVAAMRQPGVELERYSRWGRWERDILAKLPEPSDAQAVIRERQLEVDTDAEEAAVISEAFAGELAKLNYDTSRDRVFIPSGLAADWYRAATGSREMRTTAATSAIDQLIEEGDFPRLQRNKCRTWGRGFVWHGAEVEPNEQVKTEIEERLRRVKQDS